MVKGVLLPQLRELLANGKTEEIRELCASSHPRIIADMIAELSTDDIWKVLSFLEPELRGDIFSNLDEDIQLEIARSLKRHELAKLLTGMPHDDRVDLYNQLPERTREALMPALAQAEREDLRRLSSYEEGTAGSIMTSEYATLKPLMTVKEALETLRREAPDTETIYYAYVVDDHRRLIGLVSLKDLILANPENLIEDMMYTDIIYANVYDDQETVANKIQKYDLLALPIVNGGNVLVGIVTYDDAMDVLTQEYTEDIEKQMAITGTHEPGVYLKTPIWEHFKSRYGWIVILAILGFVSGYIVQSFEGMLMQFAILATFMPMLTDTGGNTGSQSATLVVRALALKEISLNDVKKILFKELNISILLGILVGIIAFVRALFFSGGVTLHGHSLAYVGATIAIALALQVVSATLIGAVLPLIAARFKLDPAVVASPALTTIVDITGLFIFFTTAKLMLGL